MTTAPDQTTKPQSDPFDLLTAPGLPRRSDSTTTADLVGALDLAAARFLQCKSAYCALSAMTAAERDACPEFRTVLQIARFGMAEARQLQGQAVARLNALNAYPEQWAAWPHRPNPPTPQPG